MGDGPHQLTAIARDTAGNVSSASVSVTVSNYVPPVDITAPSVAITSPKDGDRLTANTQVTVNASDNVGVVRNELYLDGNLVGSSTTAPFSIRLNTKKIMGAGSHTLQCRVYDAAGNVGVSQLLKVTK